MKKVKTSENQPANKFSHNNSSYLTQLWSSSWLASQTSYFKRKKLSRKKPKWEYHDSNKWTQILVDLHSNVWKILIIWYLSMPYLPSSREFLVRQFTAPKVLRSESGTSKHEAMLQPSRCAIVKAQKSTIRLTSWETLNPNTYCFVLIGLLKSSYVRRVDV